MAAAAARPAARRFLVIWLPYVEKRRSGEAEVAGTPNTLRDCGLTCDNLETLVYLHEVWPKTREWEARKKLRVV